MKIIARNKKINFNYETIETFKAGLVLEGLMVKANICLLTIPIAEAMGFFFS